MESRIIESETQRLTLFGDILTLIGSGSRQDGGVELLDFSHTLVDFVDAGANVLDLEPHKHAQTHRAGRVTLAHLQVAWLN